jgi:HlyD family secretion protein
MGSKSIFREKALATLATPEELDARIRIVAPQLWLGLLALLAVMCIAGIWGWFGRVDTKVSGAGMLIRLDGIRSVPAQMNGTVKYINVIEGSRVVQNQMLGAIDLPVMELEIKQLVEKSVLIESQFSELMAEERKNSILRDEYFKRMDEVTAKTVANLKSIQNYLDEASGIYGRLQEKGIISKIDFFQMMENSINAAVEVVQQKGNSYRLPLDRFDFEYAKKRLLWEKLRELRLTNDEIEMKKMSMATRSLLLSPVAGTIANVMKRSGDNVSVGDSVFTILPEASNPMTLTAFVPIKDWKRINVNQLVYISPTSTEPQRHGYMLGVVKAIGHYPDTDQTLEKFFQNRDLAKFMKHGLDAVISVEAELIPDSTSPTGVRWTCRNSEKIDITPGTPCNVQIVVERRPPITYAVPWLREVFLGTGTSTTASAR